MADSIGKSEGFSRTGNSEQSLKTLSGANALHQFFYRLRLVSGRSIRRVKFEYTHIVLNFSVVVTLLKIPFFDAKARVVH